MFKKGLLKKAATLKKELLRKSNSCVNLKKKVTLKNCEEVAFSKIKLSENIATYARREIAIDNDKYSWGISYEYYTMAVNDRGRNH